MLTAGDVVIQYVEPIVGRHLHRRPLLGDCAQAIGAMTQVRRYCKPFLRSKDDG